MARSLPYVRGMRNLLNWRNLLAFAHDCVAIVAAWVLAYALRFNFEIPASFQETMVRSLAWLLPLQAALFVFTGMYRGLWRYASLVDLRRIIVAVGCGAASVVALAWLLKIQHLPRSVAILFPVLLVVLMGGARVLYRAWKEGHLSRINRAGEPVIVLGAGSAAASLIKSVHRLGEWHFVGLLDDDPAKQHRDIHGVPVLGRLEDLPEVAKETRATVAVIAMPGQTHGVRRRAMELCHRAGLQAMTVPAWEDLVSGKVSVSQLRKVELDDLLGRDPVKLDSAGLMQWLQGKTVLVTGAGGSIGSELCRQLLRFGPAKLVLYELSEFATYSIEQELGPRHGATEIVYVIGDVKDRLRLDQMFRTHSPAVVFHAAAYKHVPLMEVDNAWQAVRNNALGTVRVAQAALDHGAEKFVLISTDKAVNPTSVMGASKRLAELLCQALSNARTRFVAVRFGNVLGSTGSVIPKFRKQIAAGGPVTVTHPEICRYFMSIPEAAQLVLQAGLMGQGGEIYVLDMGEPVKIVDLARELIRLSGYADDEIKIEFTGLRPGEKLYEELLADDETTLPTKHEKVRVMRSETPRGYAWVEATLRWLESKEAYSDEAVRAALRERVPEYRPAGDAEPGPQPAASVTDIRQARGTA